MLPLDMILRHFCPPAILTTCFPVTEMIYVLKMVDSLEQRGNYRGWHLVLLFAWRN